MNEPANLCPKCNRPMQSIPNDASLWRCLGCLREFRLGFHEDPPPAVSGLFVLGRFLLFVFAIIGLIAAVIFVGCLAHF
jgi:hypothetical protein